MKRYPKAFYKQYLLVILEAIFLHLSTRIAGLWLHCWLMLAPNRYGGGGGQEWCQLPGAAEWTRVGPGQCLPQHWPGFREGGRVQRRPSSRSLGYLQRAGTHSSAKINQHLASLSTTARCWEPSGAIMTLYCHENVFQRPCRGSLCERWIRHSHHSLLTSASNKGVCQQTWINNWEKFRPIWNTVCASAYISLSTLTSRSLLCTYML